MLTQVLELEHFYEKNVNLEKDKSITKIILFYNMRFYNINVHYYYYSFLIYGRSRVIFLL